MTTTTTSERQERMAEQFYPHTDLCQFCRTSVPDGDKACENRETALGCAWLTEPELSRLRNEQPKGGDADIRPVEDIYGFTCGYCGEHLNTPCAKEDHHAAEDFAQAQGWRTTLGHTDQFGGNAHVTCPDCLPAFSEAVTCSINGNRKLASAPAPSPEAQDVRERVLANFEIRQPDADGIVWLVFHGHGTAGKGMVSLGAKERVVAQVALHLEKDRQAALAQSDARPVGDDWELEQRAFNSQGNSNITREELQVLIRDLWSAYCDMEMRAKTPPRSDASSGLIEAAEWRTDIDNAPDYPSICLIGNLDTGERTIAARFAHNSWRDAHMRSLSWKPDCWLPLPELHTRAADRSAPAAPRAYENLGPDNIDNPREYRGPRTGA